MFLDATISILGGLGLFFIGVKGLGANMSQLAGRSLRRWRGAFDE
jgi:phosphate:Na+ symporter